MITIEHLTSTIQNLNEKLVLLEAKATEFDQQRTKLAESEKTRTDLSQCLQESAAKMLQRNQAEANLKNELMEKSERAIKENQELRREVDEVKGERDSFALQVKELAAHAGLLESELKILKAKVRDQVVLESSVQTLKEACKESEEKHRLVISVVTRRL